MSYYRTLLIGIKNFLELFKKRVLADSGTLENEDCIIVEEEASLQFTPSGYKENKLYSIIPSDGTGDLDFTRNSGATRVNADKIIEAACYNYLTYSEQFDNSSWIKKDSSIYIGSIINGKKSFDLIPIAGTSKGNINKLNVIPISSSTTYIRSVLLKKLNVRYVVLGASDVRYAIYDLASKVVTHKNSLIIDAGIVDNEDGTCLIWQTLNASSEQYAGFFIAPSTSSFAHFFNGNGFDGITIINAQITLGTTLKSYLKTTDRLNVPRLDHTNGSCPNILIEPQRTSLLKYSEEIDNVVWTKANSTIIINSITSPSGLINADKLSENTSMGNHGTLYSMNVTVGTIYALSIFVKKGTRRYVGLECFYNIGKGNIAFFDLDSNSLLYQFSQGTGYSITNSKIEDYQNGWVRLSASVTFGDAVAYPGICLASTQWTTNTSYNNNYIGDVNEFIYAWGAQLEVGSYATSYIPTLASAVTRNADIVNKTGISHLIGQTEGTLFFEGSVPSLDQYRITLTNGTSSDTMRLSFNIGLILVSFKGANISYDYGNNLVNTNVKLCVRYSTTETTLIVDGVVRSSASVSFVPHSSPLDRLNFHAFVQVLYFNGKVKNLHLYKTALSDAKCIELTTL